MENAELRARITNCWGSAPDAEAGEAVIAKLDRGELRVASASMGLDRA